MNGEPSLDNIDDYNDNESQQKRKTIRLVVIGLLVLGAIYGLVKYSFDDVNDYIGTKEAPGINTSKN
jgi:uncharacterized membrane protein YraQ (UPF0718 family)